MNKLILALISLIITLILVIGLHEIGHAFIARYFSIKIKRISIGFGKPLLRLKSRKGYEWIWARWPLGGYVELLNTRIHGPDSANQAEAFDKKPAWQRILVILGGPAFNFLAAWICFIGFYIIGHHDALAVIGKVQPHSLAAAAQLQPHDQIMQINQTPIQSWEEANRALIPLLNQPLISMQVKTQSGELHERSIQLAQLKFKRSDRSLWEALGLLPSQRYITWNPPLPLIQAIKAGLGSIWDFSYLFVVILKQLILGYLPMGVLVGPVQFLNLNMDAFLQGLGTFLYFIGTFSMGVGIINLLPLPGLDGSTLLYTVIEKIRGKPISVALEILFYQLTMIGLALILVQLMINDLSRVLG